MQHYLNIFDKNGKLTFKEEQAFIPRSKQIRLLGKSPVFLEN
jgi:hypothetical protein